MIAAHIRMDDAAMMRDSNGGGGKSEGINEYKDISLLDCLLYSAPPPIEPVAIRLCVYKTPSLNVHRGMAS